MSGGTAYVPIAFCVTAKVPPMLSDEEPRKWHSSNVGSDCLPMNTLPPNPVQELLLLARVS